MLTFLRVAGEVHGGLAGGVGTADEEDLGVLARDGLGLRSAVVEAGTRERLRARNVEHAVGDAGGDDADQAADLAAVSHGEEMVGAIATQGADLLCHELRPETACLQIGALAEFFAAEAVGEAEVVFDARAGSLPGRRVRLIRRRGCAGLRRRRRRRRRGQRDPRQ